MSDVENKERFKNIAVIVAGGKGLRMQSTVKKQFIDLEGIPVIVRTLAAFDRYCRVDEIILVVPEQDLNFTRNDLLHRVSFSTPLHIIKGGVTRQDSVGNGLDQALKICTQPETTFVLIHDGVRPFVGDNLLDRCLDGALQEGACIPVLGIADTVKRADKNGKIICTLDRDGLFRAQTPQVFRLDLMIKAASHARKTGFLGTDEASVCEHAKIPVAMVEGGLFNIKLTSPQDLIFAGLIIRAKKEAELTGHSGFY
ncbi:2-C-methyl-D-erythritol 4-phosphate cytidylyltransferase [Desulfobacter latus]|uniref:2-C-methyl-D-erythritol 4-phosphate cytidylyltransferase n=1 Tax=Desulfobacter latus TaxID=2292 RepID=A0A850SUK7_9BACT|nr:2-C-methyl-D-erythritol 4-phosphate cytidylyltransferase [Desulfobacter latus]NWH04829.1 2-C-methyl-D-erythritol 4-phosphate cytidylyltransferase [Desulfobacter latus]